MSWSEDWNPLRQKYIFRSGYWELAHQILDVRCVRTNYSSFEPLQFILYRTASHIGTKRYRVLCRHGQRWKKIFAFSARAPIDSIKQGIHPTLEINFETYLTHTYTQVNRLELSQNVKVEPKLF